MSRAHMQKAGCVASWSPYSNGKVALESLVCVGAERASKSGQSGRIGGLLLPPRVFLALSRYGAGQQGT